MTMGKITTESGAVQSYLSILQGVIGRMATNSTSCKTWCIALVSATLVIVANKESPGLVWLCVLPIVLLLYLDSYYLTLEREFRRRYDDFIRKLHTEEAAVEDLFLVRPDLQGRSLLTGLMAALKSVSIWPFYSLLVVMVPITRIVMESQT